MRVRTRLRIAFFVLFVAVICCISDNNFIDPFDSQPRIVINDGHIVFETARNRNITFKSSGGGSISVNGEDLSKIVELGKSANIEMQRSSSSKISEISQSLAQLQSQYTNLAQTVVEMRLLQATLNDSSNKINQILGTGSNALQPRTVRRAIRKIQRMETNLNQLTQLLQTNECDSTPCRNGGTCIDTFNGYICRCLPTWEGPTCESDVNECLRFVGTDLGCQHGSTCRNSPGSYTCDCGPNWFGIHCTEQMDDCSSATNEALCGHGTCINQKRSLSGLPNYRCICEQGWTTSGNSPACIVDVNECTSSRPHCSMTPPVTCINLPGTFHCGACPHGYTGNGYYCNDINECDVNNGGCSQSPRVQCTNTIGSRICGPCPIGYNGNGVVCSFIGICRVNNGGCHPLAQCFENMAISAGFRECRCPAGYMGSGVGPSGCVGQTGTNCNNNPCVHGSCFPNGDSFTCICNTGFSGSLCELEINECLSNPCLNGGTCTDQQNGFLCVCTNQWQGSTCEEPRETCGGTLASEIGTINYPSNPNTLYPNRVSCAWIISTTIGKVLNITFRSFNVESTQDCTYDFLQIHDGPNAGAHSLGRYCGGSLPRGGNIITTHHQIYLWFKSDHSVAHEGFQLDWNTTNPVCGGELDVKDYGSVNSPGYPGSYAHNRDCYWLVRVPLGKRIQFHFATLQIETHSDCSFDFLEIIDGQRENDALLGKFCNSTTPPPLTTSGSYALLHFHSDDSLTDHGFHITYASVPGIPGCGGTLTAEKGSFTSPNFPDRYDNNIECDWLIRVHPLERIQIKFTLFDLEQHTRCRFDYLEIRDGDSNESPLINRFCGQEIPQPIISTGNKVWIKFRADYSFTGQGFRAQYTTACGGLYTDLVGIVKSPFFPDSYPSDRNCLYHIVLPPGSLVQLAFEYFDVEGSIDCAYDYLEVRESHENGTELGRFCGSVIPDTITSRYNELWLKFGTDGSVSNRGFLANYTNIDIGCGGVYTTNHGSIATPNHPNFYPHSSRCSWLIRAEVGFVIRLTFTVFSLEEHSVCNYDYVEVKDSNNARIGKYCGNRLPPVLTSTGNELFITFKSDRNRAQEGFAAAYSFMDVRTSCGGNYFTDSGIIRSPGYPTANYPPQRDCTWIVQVQNGRQIVLNVTHFELEGGSGCHFDYLEIRNGREDRSPLIGQFCGTGIPPSITSHGHVMYLRFKTDRSMSAKGFEITYDSGTTGCGGTLTSQTGSIESPGYPQPYGHNAECVWTIRVSKGSVISLSVVDIDIEAHATCLFDYLEIFDGSTDRSPSLGRYCNNRMNQHFIQSKTNVLFLKFRTDTSETGRGFRLNYQINCTNTISGYRGVIESPNFPNQYNHNSNCTWNIRAPLGNNITIAFSRLIIEEAANCQYDYLEVFNVNPDAYDLQSIARYCGTSRQLPPPFNTTSNNAVVKFVTDNSIAHIGFRLEWVSVGCGGDFVNKNYGVLTSPNYPNGYPHNTECLWHITVLQGSSIHLLIEDFDLEGAEGCHFDYLNVFGGPDETSPLLLNQCHKLLDPKTVTSMGRSMTIKFRSDASITGKGFRASFSVGAGSCSGIFTTETATLISPKYPATYDASDDCEYSIEVSGLHDIELTFEDFEMPSSINCTDSYLAIFDGLTQDDPLLIRHCGNALPSNNPIRSTSNKVYLRMKANGRSVGKGFKISYKSMCGGRKIINSNEIGELTSPNYPHHSVVNLNCHWILIASLPEEHITLTFSQLDIAESDSCEQHFVEVRDGDSGGGSDLTVSPLIGKYCGNRIPVPITSQGNALYITSTMGVFRATYSTSTSYCGGEFTSEAGYFMSPGFPNSYPLESECIWIIRASPGNRVTFNFISFNIEQSEYCNTDYIELREQDASGAYLGRYCGDEVPTLNFTSTNVLWAKFRSDQSGTAQGFQAYYALQHGIELSGTSGQISSPGYPHDYRPQEAVFTWTILVPISKFVSITFVELALQASYVDCVSYVQILDGMDENAPEIGKYCGFTPPNPIAGHSNTLTVNFVMSNHMPGKFLLIWAAINETQAAVLNTPQTVIQSNTSFEITLNRTSTYRIQSPGYPSEYGTNLNYNWTIHTLQSFHFQVNVVDLNLEGTYYENYDYCYYDRVTFLVPERPLSSIWKKNKTICGRFTGVLEMPLSNLLRINFKTDSMVSRTGFDLIVSSICGGILYASNGVLSTEDVINSVKCEWTIIVREGRTIQITFEVLNIADNNNCRSSYLLLRNGGLKTSPFLGGGRYCGTTIQAIPETSSNRVLIEFYALQRLHVDFRLRYREISIGCGDQLSLTQTNRSVNIMSPNYPQLPPHDMECDWLIMSPPNTNLRLDFEFHTHPTWNCNNTIEFIEIRDGGTAVSPLIERYCVPPQITSSTRTSSNYMFIRFVTTNSQNLANFKAKIEINDCGGTYYMPYYRFQELSLPNYPNNYTDNMECNIYLRSYSLSTYFELNITSMDIPANTDCTSGDYIEFREESATGELIGRYCGSSDENNTIFFNSKGSLVSITFKSDTSRTGKGLKLMARSVYSRCGATIENAVSTGVITSPNFPNSLSESRYCQWFIFSPPGRRIKLTFMEYNLKTDLRNNTNCLDKFYVYKSDYKSSSIKMPCGSVIPDPIEIQSHLMYLYLNTPGLAAREGFRIQYSADNEEVCGGILNGNVGTITSYRFGELDYTENMDCVWDITLPDSGLNYTLAFVFDVFEIPQNNEYCRHSFFRIAYYNSRYRYIYGRDYYCGNKTGSGSKFDIFTFQSSGVEMPRVILSTNYSNGYRGISGHYYIQECGGFHLNPDGEYTSPNYPESYPRDSFCSWSFSVLWGEQLRISFDDFALGDDCEQDYVEVVQGWWQNSPRTVKYCGNNKPPDIQSTSAHMKVNFKGTGLYNTQTQRKFKMYVRKSQHGCGGLMLNYYGTIQSTNYPSRYEDNVECVWNIQMPVGYHVNFTFVERFDLEKTDNCTHDFILFEEQLIDNDEDSWSQIAKYCGHNRPEPFKSKLNKARVTFHTSADTSGDGFKLNYKIACGELLTSSSGVFASPNYPNNYNNAIRCEYLIQRNPRDFIQLDFDDFSLEEHQTCFWDSVNIYLGNTTNATHMGPYCSASTKPPSAISNSAMLITFSSDSSVSAKGFKASYFVTSCGGYLTEPSGEFQSPAQSGLDLQSLDCIWYISVHENRAIELRFISINLSNCWRCNCDFVEIRDGYNSSSPLIGRYCGQEMDSLVKSSGNQLWIRFRFSGYYGSKDFKAGYRTTLGESQGCGGVFVNVTNGFIQSPDIDSDGKYELDINCWWHFIMPVDQVVKLTFIKMDIEESPANLTKCSFDYIEVRDGLSHKSPLIDRFCGTTIPSTIIASTNNLVLQFYSDGKEVKTGFKAKFESVNASLCGGMVNVTNVTQSLQSLNYPNAYPTLLRCRYHFRKNDYNMYWYASIRLTFTDLDIDCNNNDFIEFYADTYSRHIIEPYRMCGKKAPPMIVSRPNLWMTFVTSANSATNHKGFSLNYTYSVCNQTFSDDSGMIVNPRYPDYSYYSYCRMNITAKVGQTISLYFNDFRLAQPRQSVDCLNGNITVKDGIETTSPILAVLCGVAIPQPIFSNGNQLSLELRNSYYSTKFFISYTTTNAGRGCGGNLTSFNGTFTSPLYPMPYNESNECKWFVHSFGLHSLTLRFTTFSLSSTIGCDTNFVEIYEGLEDLQSNRVMRICGDDNPAPYQSQGNVLLVKLVTNANNTAPGFKAQYNFNRIEINASKEIMTSNLSPHISHDNSYYFPSDGIMFRHND